MSVWLSKIIRRDENGIPVKGANGGVIWESRTYKRKTRKFPRGKSACKLAKKLRRDMRSAASAGLSKELLQEKAEAAIVAIIERELSQREMKYGLPRTKPNEFRVQIADRSIPPM